MNLMCLEPVFNTAETNGVTAFSAFTSDGEFRLSQIVSSNSSSASQYLKSEKTFFCYDAFKVWDTFEEEVPFLWDVKILYELLGYRSENLIGLGQEILGHGPLERYVDLSDQVKAHLRSYREVKISISAHDTVSLIPEDLLCNLYLERAKVIAKLYVRLDEKGKLFYKKFHSSMLMLHRIGEQPLNVDLAAIQSDTSHSAVAVRKYTIDDKINLKFSAIGAKTGRLGFRKNSFNPYILPKSVRHCIVPSEGHSIVEFDFKSFQPRLAIFLTDDEKFKDSFRGVQDIYSVIPGDRAENKIKFLAWMFARERTTNEVFDTHVSQVWDLRRSLVKKCKEQGYLETKWGRKLYLADQPKHIIFQNYITATEADCILQLTEFLVDSGIKVLLPFYDAVICEIPNERADLIESTHMHCELFLQEMFNTKFPVDVNTGNNFGNMHVRTMESV